MLKCWSVLALAASAALAGCNTVSSDNQQTLSMYLENAAQYYDGGDFNRAYQQWQQALDLDSGNEKARIGQVYALYQLGRINATDAMKPLAQATERIDAMRSEDFAKEQWKIELAAALVHQRWCDLYDKKVRRIELEEETGVPPDAKELDTAKREFARHIDIAETAFRNVLAGSEREPRDRLTCWLGLAIIASWREDLDGSLRYAQLYVEQAVRSKKLWKDSAARYPMDKPVFDAKYTGAEMQEADLRELMGAVLVRLGREDEAEAEVDKVIAMFPRRSTAYLNRGILRQQRGEDDLARADYRKFLAYTELPENDPAILEAAKRLTEVETKLAAQEAMDAQPSPGESNPR